MNRDEAEEILQDYTEALAEFLAPEQPRSVRKKYLEKLRREENKIISALMEARSYAERGYEMATNLLGNTARDDQYGEDHQEGEGEKLMTEREVINATNEHIDHVRNFMYNIAHDIIMRAQSHDMTKLMDPELPIFVEYTPKLKDTTYGSDEYKQYLKEMRVALDHHYAENRHHPEHFDNGVNGMNLIDLIEMLCDWKAATLRHNDGDIIKSIDINEGRFGISEQLKGILKNTVNSIRDNI